MHFNIKVPTGAAAHEQLQRVPLDLSRHVERGMRSILQLCGDQVRSKEGVGSSKKHRQEESMDRQRPEDDADRFEYGFASSTMHDEDMEENPTPSENFSRRKRRRLTSMADFFAFLADAEAIAAQQQVERAWQSLQSATNTIKREFGVRDVTFSCGWSSLHLNATVMVLLRTLRVQAAKRPPSTRQFLQDARIDIR